MNRDQSRVNVVMATMNPLLTILRAAHCRSTHHFFAIDALPLVGTAAGDRLGQILLRHHDRYLAGAKDPDTRFRDFQNHVVHVTDGYWGGAPRVAHQWYDRLQRYLRSDRWADAAHAAGVLSHYFTDPMMPLHTQQCEREKVLHRPIEWSVTKSYRTIMKLWKEDSMRIVFDLSDGPGWLGEAILHGARHANQFYFPLMDTYDLRRGRKNPEAGLSLIAKQSLAELFGLAVTGWARVIERAAADAEAAIGKPLPRASTSVGMLLATTRMPMRLLLRKIEHHFERVAVQELISEFDRTGGLKSQLPAEVDIVHRVIKVYEDEKNWKQRRQQLQSTRTKVSVEKVANITPAVPAVSLPEERPMVLPFPIKKTAAQLSQTQPGHTTAFLLSGPNALVDAPSIGPRTADRFTSIGVHTVQQFLDASAQDMADALATRWINRSTIELWQTQAKVMCEVRGLNCLPAQLLAGAGYQSRQVIAASDPAELHARVSQYAATSAGQRYLRRSSPPKLADVTQWITNACQPSQPSRKAA